MIALAFPPYALGDLAHGICGLLVLGAFLVSGLWVFGRSFGSPTRGAALPLLFVPVVADWIRLVSHCSFSLSWLLSAIAYFVLAGIWWFTAARQRGVALKNLHWLWLALAFIVFFGVLRIWLISGTNPNPADDVFSGYKANALLNSASWPTAYPEASELDFSYYYYAYMWPAALGSWFGLTLWAGWWATATVLCATGAMLAIELLLPRLRSRPLLVIAGMIIVTGASLCAPLLVIAHMPLKVWLNPIGAILKGELQFPFPQHIVDYWMPFNVFAAGIVLQVSYIMLQSLRLTWKTKRTLFAVFGLGALAGYCTFDLLGFVLVAMPALGLVTIKYLSSRRWLKIGFYFALTGFAAVILSLPYLSQIAQRNSDGRITDLNHLPGWLLETHPSPARAATIISLWLVFMVLRNPLGWIGFFTAQSIARPSWVFFLRGLFLLGICLSFFGVVLDFVPKFGIVIALAGIFLFWERPRPGKWMILFLLICLLEPLLMALNIVRANLMISSSDPVWRTLDAEGYEKDRPVVYSIGALRKERGVWTNTAPFFSRSAFLTPKEEFAETEVNFIRDATLRHDLASIPERLATHFPQANQYLLLGPPGSSPSGQIIYQSSDFTVSIEAMPSQPNPSTP